VKVRKFVKKLMDVMNKRSYNRSIKLKDYAFVLWLKVI